MAAMEPELEAAFNEQLGAELYSSHLYLSMSAYGESIGMPGAAHWFRVQAEEERGHALRFFRHIVDRGGRVLLGEIPAPPTSFSSLREAFEQALEQERQVSAAIDRLVGMATERGDHAAQVFLQWFVTEQVEEEKQVGELVAAFRAIGEDPTGLFMLDRELAAREA